MRSQEWPVGLPIETFRELEGDAKKALFAVGAADKQAWLHCDGEAIQKELRLTGEDIFACCGYYAEEDIDIADIQDFEAYLFPLTETLDLQVLGRDFQSQGVSKLKARMTEKRLGNILAVPGGSVIASRDPDSREVKGVLGYTRAIFIDQDEDVICLAITIQVFEAQENRDHAAALRAAFMRQVITDYETIIDSQARAGVALPMDVFIQSSASVEHLAEDFLELIEEGKNEAFEFRGMPDYIDWATYDTKISNYAALG
jgi:hypothetical protein